MPVLVDDKSTLSLGSSGKVPGRVQGGSRKVSFGGLWRNCIRLWENSNKGNGRFLREDSEGRFRGRF